VGDAGPATRPVQPRRARRHGAGRQCRRRRHPDAADLAVPAPAVAAGNYAVTFGAYASRRRRCGDRLPQALRLPGFAAGHHQRPPAWRVRVGPYADRRRPRRRACGGEDPRRREAAVITLDAAPRGAPAATVSTPAPAPATSTRVRGHDGSGQYAGAQRKACRHAGDGRCRQTGSGQACSDQARAGQGRSPKPAPAKAEPAKPAVATTPKAPAASGVGFAVQLGAFGQANDANALRDKVRAAGFSAFVEQVAPTRARCTASASARWPTARGREAQGVRRRQGRRRGMVRPHP
jgi:cell division septation protein DedD